MSHASEVCFAATFPKVTDSEAHWSLHDRSKCRLDWQNGVTSHTQQRSLPRGSLHLRYTPEY